MRQRFDSEYIRSDLERVGDHLADPLTVYIAAVGT